MITENGWSLEKQTLHTGNLIARILFGKLLFIRSIWKMPFQGNATSEIEVGWIVKLKVTFSSTMLISP